VSDISTRGAVGTYSKQRQSAHARQVQARQREGTLWHIARIPLAALFILLALPVLAPAAVAHATTTEGTWTSTSSLQQAHTQHTATLLPGGNVLVAGGAGGDSTASEIYDPNTGSWSYTTTKDGQGTTTRMHDGRSQHTATLLTSGPEKGQVLVVGGRSSSGTALNSAELYDPTTGVWSRVTSMQDARYQHTATLLSDGAVLVAGGIGKDGTALTSAEIYNPGTDMWSYTGAGGAQTTMTQARYGHTATLLPNGKVLVAGGEGGNDSTAETYSSSDGSWTATTSMSHGRSYHTATLLHDSTVLVAGGNSYGATAETYNPSNDSWTATAPMADGRSNHTATLLGDGTVLVTGGSDLSSAEIYEPTTRSWAFTNNMSDSRSYHTATYLPATGQVLVAGGSHCCTTDLQSAELYQTTTNRADLDLSKAVSNAAPRLHDQVIFTLTITNKGPQAATNVQVTDQLPGGLTYVSDDSASTGTTYNSTSGVWAMGSLGNGESKTLKITASVETDRPTTNKAAITASDAPDSNTANNAASATITPSNVAELSISKYVDNTYPKKGDQVNFTVTVANYNGPDDATGVQVTDKLPAGLTYLADDANSSGNGSYDYKTGVWSVGAVDKGASKALHITARVDTPDTGDGARSATNTATISHADQSNVNGDNLSASAAVYPTVADLQLSKTVDSARPTKGGNVVYTLTVTDNGPKDATGVQITDNLPAGLTFVDSSDNTAYQSGVWSVGSLGNGKSKTLTITAQVNTTSKVTNYASITQADQPDQYTNNNSASVDVQAAGTADLALNKSVDVPNQDVGKNVTFTIHVTNGDHYPYSGGPDTATGVEVTDKLPTGLTYVSDDSKATNTTYDPSTGVWVVGSLAYGSDATLHITARVDATSKVTNNAAITHEDQADPTTDDNTASADVDPNVANIGVVKTVDTASPSVGRNVTYTIVATNNGPRDASSVTVSDQLPSGLTLVSATPSQGTYDGDSSSSTYGQWMLGGLNNGSSATLKIVATANTTNGARNCAQVTAVEPQDRNGANDSSCVDITPVDRGTADLSLTKSVNKPTQQTGQNVQFTVTVANAKGPDNATGVQVTDKLPAGLTYLSDDANSSGNGSYDNKTGVWSVGAVDKGASKVLHITARVDANSTVTNNASITAEDQADPTPKDDSDSAVVTPNTANGLAGTVYGPDGKTALGGAPVQACTVRVGYHSFARISPRSNVFSYQCSVTAADGSGHYSFGNLIDGSYSVTAYPPGGQNYLPQAVQVNISGGTASPAPANITLPNPTLPSNGASIGSNYTGGGNVPVVFSLRKFALRLTGCNANGSYDISQGNPGTSIANGTLVYDGAGMDSAQVGPLTSTSVHGPARVTLTCGSKTQAFDIYIDPSGAVHDTAGNAIAGATVTLLKSDSNGNFVAVPADSAVMSPANRRNPDATSNAADSLGYFGWDVIAGTYRIRVTKDGYTCPIQTYTNQHCFDSRTVETGDLVVMVNNPITGLDLRLQPADQQQPVTSTATPELGSGELMATGLLPLALALALLYRRRTRQSRGHDEDIGEDTRA